LTELCALIAGARLLVCTDSGPRHLAQALGTPCALVAGPTDPRHTADHAANVRLARVEVPCGPCHRERCPLTGADELNCMRNVQPERLIALVRDPLR
jgi:heptosyltransferase II